MSRSRKDGRRGGGHPNTQNREVWSRRCAKVNMWPIDDADYKRITHRHERRQAKRWIASEVEEPPTLEQELEAAQRAVMSDSLRVAGQKGRADSVPPSP